MKLLGVITARGGSKGIPGKNIRPLAGTPLLAYTIESARASGVLDRLILSTEDAAIAAVAREYGCEVPFMRPAELAADETPHLPVMQHAVEWLGARGYRPDAVVILQPTSPLRRPEDIRGAAAILEASGADSVVSVSDVPSHHHPLRALRVNPSGDATLFVTGEPVRRRLNRRQDFPPAVVMDGSLYLFRTHVLSGAAPSLYGDRTAVYRTPAPFGLSIDEPQDWVEVERALGTLRAHG